MCADLASLLYVIINITLHDNLSYELSVAIKAITNSARDSDNAFKMHRSSGGLQPAQRWDQGACLNEAVIC